MIEVRVINGKGDWSATPPTGVDEGDYRGQVTDFLLRAGIVNTDDFEVTEKGTPDMSVDVASGTVYIENDAYVLNSNETKYYDVFMDGTENVAISSNASGSTRIDLIVVEVDKITSPDDDAQNVATITVVEGTPGSGAPAKPDNSSKLSEVTVTSGASSITNANITDFRSVTAWGAEPLDDSVSTDSLQDNAVTTPKLANEAVETAKIDDLAVTNDKIANDAAWKEIGRTTLGSAGTTITVDNLPIRKYIMVLLRVFPTGGTVSLAIRFNNDSGDNYARRRSADGGTDSTAGSQNSIFINTTNRSTPYFGYFYVVNESTQEKLVDGRYSNINAAGAANAPAREVFVGKWANTANAITRVDILTSTNQYNTGSEVVVLGRN